MKLTRGGNSPVAASTVTVSLEWGSPHEIDAQAVLLADTGKIRTNDDFVFYNAATHPSGAVMLRTSEESCATLSISLAAVEAPVSRIVIAGSVDQGSFRDIRELTLSVRDENSTLIIFDVDRPDPVTAMVLGEFYRRNGAWRFRAVGQGWASGLRGLAEEFGVEVDDSPDTNDPHTAPPMLGSPEPGRGYTFREEPQTLREAGWYPESADSERVRWWNGTTWTDDTRQLFPPDPSVCDRCGRPKRISRFGTPPPCRWCESEVNGFMEIWRSQAWQVLTTSGPRGAAWDELWTALRFQRIDQNSGREALRPLAMAYLERVVTFAFADGEIEQHELDSFEQAVSDLQEAVDLGAAQLRVNELRQRMLRGRSLSQVRAGELPRLQRPDLHLEADETLHIDVNAAQVKYLATGPRHSSGRLVGSNRKFRFVGAGAGTELPWSKIVSITSEYGNVIISATTARGGGTYSVADPEYVAAVLEGALRIAKRLVLAPGQRDSRAIPSHVKTAVWQRDGGRCCECGDTHYLEFDHIIPLSRGGATSIGNLQILCRRCNLEKGARL
ncbi:TerD family protein [Nocardia beijingensis]|uniref:TerD family protein n=1 Tax=Nocardia beijingensis TaxID=95162 RepID=UPI002B4B175B|nr:TerD family protein [Nocardia beijingensis]